MAEDRVPATRREMRILALQILFEADAVGRDPLKLLDRDIDEHFLSRSGRAFLAGLVRGVLENLEELDKIVARFAPSWPLNQMAIVDRNLLRMAVYELTGGGDTPPKVAINEAVELARVFGSESSSRFVNGVLGSVAQTTGR
jgi:N utilization substance protein B